MLLTSMRLVDIAVHTRGKLLLTLRCIVLTRIHDDFSLRNCRFHKHTNSVRLLPILLYNNSFDSLDLRQRLTLTIIVLRRSTTEAVCFI